MQNTDISLNINTNNLLEELIFNMNMNTALRRSTRETNRYKYILSDKGKRQLRKHIFKTYLYEQHECPISLEKFKDQEVIIRLPCEHIFRKDAIEEWVEENPSCPVCRFKLDTEKIENNTNNTNNNRFLNSNISFLNTPYNLNDISNNDISNNLQRLEHQFANQHIYSTLVQLFNQMH